MSRRELLRPDGERGVTLVEMSIVMVLLGAILAFTLGSVAAFQRSANGGVRRVENLNEGRILMQVITRDIRTAAKLDSASAPFFVNPSDPTLSLADDNDLTFYANLNQSTQCPKKVRLYIDGSDKLIESVTEPDATSVFPTCTYNLNTPRNRLVGRYIANAADEPVFTFYWDEDGDGVLDPFCFQVDASIGCATDDTPLTVEDALLVKAIGIELGIRKDTSLSVDHTTIVNRVRLPNVYYNPPPED